MPPLYVSEGPHVQHTTAQNPLSQIQQKETFHQPFRKLLLGCHCDLVLQTFNVNGVAQVSSFSIDLNLLL